MEIPRLDGMASYPTVMPVTALSPQQRAEQRQLIQAVRAMNESEFFGDTSELTFSLDPDTRRPIFKLIDKRTQEVIRQVPPEYLLRLAQESSSR
jgi:flagellar protein FlaG